MTSSCSLDELIAHFEDMLRTSSYDDPTGNGLLVRGRSSIRCIGAALNTSFATHRYGLGPTHLRFIASPSYRAAAAVQNTWHKPWLSGATLSSPAKARSTRTFCARATAVSHSGVARCHRISGRVAVCWIGRCGAWTRLAANPRNRIYHRRRASADGTWSRPVMERTLNLASDLRELDALALY
jgi:hypothetical protein